MSETNIEPGQLRQDDDWIGSQPCELLWLRGTHAAKSVGSRTVRRSHLAARSEDWDEIKASGWNDRGGASSNGARGYGDN